MEKDAYKSYLQGYAGLFNCTDDLHTTENTLGFALGQHSRQQGSSPMRYEDFCAVLAEYMKGSN